MVFSMYLACLLSLCQYLINVKKFNRSGPNVFFAPHKTLGKVHKPLIVKINNVSWKKVDIIFDNLPIQKELRQNFRTIKVGGYQLNVQNVDRKGGHWYFYLDFWTDTSLSTFNLQHADVKHKNYLPKIFAIYRFWKFGNTFAYLNLRY